MVDQTPPNFYCASRRIFLPRDTNHHGAVFGGAILSEMDLAGATECKRHLPAGKALDVVTISVKDVTFERPVPVGETVTVYTRPIAVGKTSITVFLSVRAGDESVCEGTFVYVTVTKDAVTGKNRKEPHGLVAGDVVR